MADLEFEQRLTATLRSDAERAVRPFDAVAIAVGATVPLVRRQPWSALRGAVAVAVLALAAAVALYVAGAMRDLRTVHDEPRPAAFDADGRLFGATVWAADAPALPGIELAGRVHLVIGYGGASASLRGRSDDPIHLASDAAPGTRPGELQFTLAVAEAGCQRGAVGTYLAEASTDGMQVRLTAVEDPCAPRAAAFQRTWYRTLRLHSDGGTGLVDAFDPLLRMTVVPGEWRTTTYEDAFTMADELTGLEIEVVKNAQGLTDPCRDDGGEMVPIGPGADAFTAYLDGLPGVSAVAADAKLGGYPARRIVATWSRPSGCAPTRSPVAWRLNMPSLHRMDGGLGGTDIVHVIEAGDATLLISAGRDGALLRTFEVLPGLPQATGPP